MNIFILVDMIMNIFYKTSIILYFPRHPQHFPATDGQKPMGNHGHGISLLNGIISPAILVSTNDVREKKEAYIYDHERLA